MIFDETTLRKLNRLNLVARQVRAGRVKGERRSVKRGTSLEFADYRNYAPGDDLRRLDWKVYGRLDRPFLKLFEEEEDLAVHVLVDGSQSMDWGEGEQHKFAYALKLAAALGVIALSAGDSLTISVLYRSSAFAGSETNTNAPRSPAQYGPTRGQPGILPLLRFFEGLRASGPTDLARSLRDYGVVARRPGLAFVISDLFTPGLLQDSLAQLQGRGYEVSVLHVLSPEEISPALAGDLRLVDVETGQAVEVTIDAGMRRLYEARVVAWRDEIGVACRGRGVHYLPLVTSQPWDEVVFEEMRRSGVVK
jgi:uncharacterized protein (DUF58 family)